MDEAVKALNFELNMYTEDVLLPFREKYRQPSVLL